MTREELQQALTAFIEARDEKAIERFLIDHYQELPDDIKGTVLLSFYTESLAKEADEARITALQEHGVAALDALAAEEKDASGA